MKSTSKEALDTFGALVVREVYDRSCDSLIGTITHGMRGIKSDPLHLEYKTLDPEAALILRKFVIKAIDQTFAQFLAFLDNHNIPISISISNGETVNVTSVSDGLAAEPYNEWGWIARYSNYKNGIPDPDIK